MKRQIKNVESLTIDDFKRSPIWEFINDDSSALGDTAVREVTELPPRNLTGKIIGTQVRLANGTYVWGIMSNVSASNPVSTKHFLSLVVLHDGKRFPLSRYHDIAYSRRGPAALAAFLGMSLEQVFPITFDIRAICPGNPAALSGTIEADPKEKLSRDQIIEMAVRGES